MRFPSRCIRGLNPSSPFVLAGLQKFLRAMVDWRATRGSRPERKFGGQGELLLKEEERPHE
jgi:hypothetical protein